MPTENIFPTKVYLSMIDEFTEVQNEIANVIDTVKFRETNDRLAYASNISDVSRNVLDDYGLHKTAAMIDRHIGNYCQALEFPMRPYRIYSWFTKTNLGNYLNTHHHNDTDIAGTYYFQSNSLDGALYFESPVGPAPHSICFSKQHFKIDVAPEPGKIVLVPGWLMHGVYKNTTDHTRIGLSFNIGFQR
jgi:uncharacterized protein (TIGR02466 family)